MCEKNLIKSSSHTTVITVAEFINMIGRDRVNTKIALNKKVKSGTATEADIQTIKNYEDAQNIRGKMLKMSDREIVEMMLKENISVNNFGK